MDLVHCIYCSTAANRAFTPSDLLALLGECRVKNALVDVTGVLLYQEASFFQVLEGDRNVVEALFAKIETDKRHVRTTKIVLESIPKRSFGAWTMGYPKLTRKDLADIPGLNDFFMQGSSFMELDEGRAKALLSAFNEGKWRASVS